MILVVGLSPAWQQMLLFDRLELGEVNRAREAHWCAAGKVINAAKALHRLGGPCRSLAAAGGPPLDEMDRELAGLGMDRRWVVTGSATRVCTTLIHHHDAGYTVTELVENARPLASGEYDAFLEAYAEEAQAAEIVVMIGSTPEGTPPSVFHDLLERTSGKAIIDARGEELLQALEKAPYVVKPNRGELAATLGLRLGTDDDLEEAMREVNRRGAEWVIVTEGGRAVRVSSAQGRLYRLPPPRVDVVNPIACGDSFAGALAWGLYRGRDFIDSVRLGMGAAAQNLQDVFLARVDRETVESLAARISVEES